MEKSFKIREDILLDNVRWWTYMENDKYYLFCDDFKMAEFVDIHACKLFERDFKNKIKKEK